jgi:hypothetical protein
MEIKASEGRQQPRLNPGQNLDFPVVVPEGVEAWRVVLAYWELGTPNKFADIYDQPAAPNKLTNVVDRLWTLLEQPPKARSRPGIARTGEVVE